MPGLQEEDRERSAWTPPVLTTCRLIVLASAGIRHWRNRGLLQDSAARIDCL